MPSPVPVIAALVLLLIVLTLIPLVRRMRAQRVSTFQAKVLEKKERTTMTYAGVFIPIVIYYLRVENGIEITVSHGMYTSVDIGDTVPISRYSDGSYRLDR